MSSKRLIVDRESNLGPSITCRVSYLLIMFLFVEYVLVFYFIVALFYVFCMFYAHMILGLHCFWHYLLFCCFHIMILFMLCYLSKAFYEFIESVICLFVKLSTSPSWDTPMLILWWPSHLFVWLCIQSSSLWFVASAIVVFWSMPHYSSMCPWSTIIFVCYSWSWGQKEKICFYLHLYLFDALWKLVQYMLCSNIICMLLVGVQSFICLHDSVKLSSLNAICPCPCLVFI